MIPDDQMIRRLMQEQNGDLRHEQDKHQNGDLDCDEGQEAPEYLWQRDMGRSHRLEIKRCAELQRAIETFPEIGIDLRVM